MNLDSRYLLRHADCGQKGIRLAGRRESESGQANEGEAVLTSGEGRRILAQIVAERIKELHATRKTLAEKSGASTAIMREIEHTKELAPYLENINAIPGLQKDTVEIKVRLGITADIIHEDS